MATLAENGKRYRLSVPKEDIPVMQWLDAQVNISVSLRTLIRDDIAKNGYTDATCRDVNIRKGAGRPAYTEQQRAAEEELEKLEARKKELLKQKQQMSYSANEPSGTYGNPVPTPAPQMPAGGPVDDVLSSMLG